MTMAIDLSVHHLYIVKHAMDAGADADEIEDVDVNLDVAVEVVRLQPRTTNPTISSATTICAANGNVAVQFSIQHRLASLSNCTAAFHWGQVVWNHLQSNPYLFVPSNVPYSLSVHCRHSTMISSMIDPRDCCSVKWPSALYVCPIHSAIHLSVARCIAVQCFVPNHICLVDSSYCRIDIDDKNLGHCIDFVRLSGNDSEVQNNKNQLEII